jgi:hypothetical protein
MQWTTNDDKFLRWNLETVPSHEESYVAELTLLVKLKLTSRASGDG